MCEKNKRKIIKDHRIFFFKVLGDISKLKELTFAFSNFVRNDVSSVTGIVKTELVMSSGSGVVVVVVVVLVVGVLKTP